MKSIMMAAVVAVSAFALEGCVENAATGKSNFSLIGESGEREIGQQTAEASIKRFGLYKPGSAVNTYVTNLCQKMFAVTEGAASQPVSCILIDSEEYNAWATPGYINVFRGFLPYVNSEAELAAVLGHESGHITARHIGQSVTNSTLAGLLLAAGGIVVASQMGDDSARVATQLGSVAAGATLASFSRSDEHEADALGQRYMPRAGYDPRESVNMIAGMQSYQAYMEQFMQALNGQPVNRNGLEKWFSSHPATPERLANAVRHSGPPDGGVQLPEGIQPATPRDDPQGRTRYLNVIDGLDVGPQTAWGVAGRNHLTLPRAHTRLSIPDGFVLAYAEGAEKPEDGNWIGRHPVSGVAVKVIMATMVSGQNAGNVLLGLSGVDSGSVRRVMVKAPEGQREAYTAQGRNSKGNPQWFMAISIPEAHPPFEKEKGRVVVAGFTFPDATAQTREQDAIAKSLAQSEVLTESNAKKVQSLKLAVRTATAGDNVEAVSSKLPQGTLREEWFRALNNLPAGEMRVGQKYKTVIDPNL